MVLLAHCQGSLTMAPAAAATGPSFLLMEPPALKRAMSTSLKLQSGRRCSAGGYQVTSVALEGTTKAIRYPHAAVRHTAAVRCCAHAALDNSRSRLLHCLFWSAAELALCTIEPTVAAATAAAAVAAALQCGWRC
jgi:hypothetical protein